MDSTAVIERYLALISDPAAEPADIDALLDPDMRFIERPSSTTWSTAIGLPRESSGPERSR